jgi:hypothetical protein
MPPGNSENDYQGLTENDCVSGRKWFGKRSLWAPVQKENESGEKGLDMDGGPIMPSQVHRYYGRSGGSLGGGHVLPFARGLMKKYNKSHSQEHWYGVSEETQEDMCGVPRLMCGGRMG